MDVATLEPLAPVSTLPCWRRVNVGSQVSLVVSHPLRRRSAPITMSVKAAMKAVRTKCADDMPTPVRGRGVRVPVCLKRFALAVGSGRSCGAAAQRVHQCCVRALLRCWGCVVRCVPLRERHARRDGARCTHLWWPCAGQRLLLLCAPRLAS